MLNTPILLLFHQICIDTVFFIQVGVDIHFTYIVEKIKIKIIHSALFKLFLENFLHLRHVGQVISGKFGCQIKAVARIFRQRLSHHQFRISVVVSPCSVIIIDPMLHRIGNHLFCRRAVNLRVIAVHYWQTHCAHAKRR